MTLQEQMQSVMLELYRNGIRYDESVREFKKLFILTTLEDCNFNQCHAAASLGMHRNTLKRTLSVFGINPKELKRGRKPPRSVTGQAVRLNAG